MALPYQTSGWDTHSEVKLREIEYPLEGEPAHFTVTRTYEGPSSTYTPVAMDTADGEFGSAKLIRQGPLVDVGGGCIRYDRVFATIPASWSDSEDFAITFPSYFVGISFGSTFTVTAINASGANYVLSTTATGISIADDVFIDLEFTRGGRTYHTTFREKAVAVSSGASVAIGGFLAGSGTFSSVSGSVRKGNTGRTLPLDIVVGTRLLNDYALTSEANLDTDLPYLDKFSPVTSTGYETSFLSTGTATVPNSDTYAAMIKNGVEIVAERSTRRRYMGNIWVRTTRLAKAR